MFFNWQIQIEPMARIAIAIFIEAAPFLLLGSILAAVIEVFVDQERLARLVPRNLIGGVALGVGAGMILPTCECGVVPIVRKLLAKGVPPSTAMTYMLAAPVINPIVLISTYVAFQGRWSMVAARAVLVVIPAAVIGLALGNLKPDQLLLEKNNHSGCGHDHFPMFPAEACGCGHVHPAPGRFKIASVLEHAFHEFLDMGQYLLLGSFAAAAFKVLMPWNMTAVFESNIFLAVGFMMTLAILLSVCSEADAFVAASFASFPLAAKLSFVAVGPMVDLKLMGMYYSVFRKPVVLLLILGPVFMVYGASLITSWLLG